MEHSVLGGLSDNTLGGALGRFSDAFGRALGLVQIPISFSLCRLRFKSTNEKRRNGIQSGEGANRGGAIRGPLPRSGSLWDGGGGYAGKRGV